MGQIAYDDEYTGPALEPEEGERLAKVIGDQYAPVHGQSRRDHARRHGGRCL